MTFACLGPLPDPHPPRFAMPAGATDCHAHVIGLPPAYPFVGDRGYTPPEATLEGYRAMHARLGIERAVIVTPSVHGTDNRITLEGIAGYGPGARGVAVVDPGISDDDLAALHAGGIRGIRLNVLFGGGVGLDAFRTLAPRVAEMGWHVQLLIHITEHLEVVEPEIRRLRVPVVVDHMGYLPVREGLEHPAFVSLLRLLGDGLAWTKLSGNYRISGDHPHYRDAIPTAKALIAANPDHMVWGTDWPHVALRDHMPDTGDLLDAVDDYAPDAALKKAILTDNPARLYGFGPADRG
jgi:predicted TIM-barrel fold metal-dependent hydrolase